MICVGYKSEIQGRFPPFHLDERIDRDQLLTKILRTVQKKVVLTARMGGDLEKLSINLHAHSEHLSHHLFYLELVNIKNHHLHYRIKEIFLMNYMQVRKKFSDAPANEEKFIEDLSNLPEITIPEIFIEESKTSPPPKPLLIPKKEIPIPHFLVIHRTTIRLSREIQASLSGRRDVAHLIPLHLLKTALKKKLPQLRGLNPQDKSRLEPYFYVRDKSSPNILFLVIDKYSNGHIIVVTGYFMPEKQVMMRKQINLNQFNRWIEHHVSKLSLEKNL